jgi:uncharacterized protein (TIGR03089 family)
VNTFADLLARRIGEDPGRPLVTYYDLEPDQTVRERVELSVTTYANWVAKAASLLAEEHDLERGQSLRLDLPTHWLGPVFLGAAWTVGLKVTLEDEPDVVVTGPDGLATWAPAAARMPVLGCALRPLGVRFADPLPDGVHDVGVDVWSQPDAFAPWDPPSGVDAATDGTTQDELWRLAAAGPSLSDGGRLLAVANPASPSGLAAFVEPLARSGSVVLVRVPEGALDVPGLERIAEDERCTHRYVGLDQPVPLTPPGRRP